MKIGSRQKNDEKAAKIDEKWQKSLRSSIETKFNVKPKCEKSQKQQKQQLNKFEVEKNCMNEENIGQKLRKLVRSTHQNRCKVEKNSSKQQ